jgi:MYXO-CTERM domain-containing protein
MLRQTAFAAIVLAAGAAAHAGLTVDFSINGVPQPTVFDNVGIDQSGLPGVIVFQHVSGLGQINLVVSQSNAPGAPDLAILEINSLSINSFSPFPLTVSFLTRDDTFVHPGSIGEALDLTSRISGTFTQAIGATLSFTSSASANPVTTAALTRNVVQQIDVFALSNTAVFNRTSTPYTLSNLLSITVPTGGQANLSGTTTVVPEPAALGLIAAGLPLLARRRR